MANYYSRYSDPRATFVMIEVRTINDDGRPGPSFNVRVTEEEFENMCANSRRQAERGQWPPPPMGVKYRPADDPRTRSYPSDPFGYGSAYDMPYYFQTPQEEREYFEKERKRKAEQQAKAREQQRERERQEHDRKEREQREKSRQEYFANFGGAADQGAEDFFRFFNEFQSENGGHQFFFEGEPVSEEEFKRRTANKNRSSTSTKSEKQLKDRLGELAGTIWMDTLDMRKVYNKAKRRCHPDVETGSHELWIELEEIARLLGLINNKGARPNYSGRSAG